MHIPKGASQTCALLTFDDDCVMCGTCAANCPAEAISEGNGKYVINADSCMECGTCAANCPVGAISVD